MRLAAKRRLLRLLYISAVFPLIALLLYLRGILYLNVQIPANINYAGGGSFLQLDDLLPAAAAAAPDPIGMVRRTRAKTVPQQRCTMATCFDINRCLDNFKVFVYPSDRNEKPSIMYKKFLGAIRQSGYFTDDPHQACLFILNLDTLDRDPLSDDFVRHLPEKISKLDHWNNGRNHLIFNFFSGSYPDYSEELDFHYGEAILAKASFSTSGYRNGFDISLPLLSKKHKEKGKHPGEMSVRKNLYPVRRRYLVVFKGKRYLWGHGSETRNSLHHLHNGKDVIMLTTCKHGRNWDRFVDARCSLDNSLYDKYEYSELIANSTFCLVPRGRRLGSFRFLESLQAGCIPVSLSNGFILPFEEVIDWSKAVLTFDERQLLQLPYLLRNVPADKIFSLRIHSQLLWREYFSSVQKVVTTTLEIIRERIQRTHGRFVWNRYPGALSINSRYSHDLSDYPFYSNIGHTNYSSLYTAVIIASEPALKGDSPLVLMMKRLCSFDRLNKIFVLWIGHGLPKVEKPTYCRVPIVVRDNRNDKLIFAGVSAQISTEAVLLLWGENVDIIMDEVEFGFSTWSSFPTRLTGFSSLRHYWDPTNRVWKVSSSPNNKYSLVSIGASFIHRYYIDYYVTRLPPVIQKMAETSLACLDLAINAIVSDITGQPPLKIAHRTSKTSQTTTMRSKVQPDNNSDDKVPPKRARRDAATYSSCLNTLVGSYGYLPFRYSLAKADPVLFGDSVSVLRKEFRKIENEI